MPKYLLSLYARWDRHGRLEVEADSVDHAMDIGRARSAEAPDPFVLWGPMQPDGPVAVTGARPLYDAVTEHRLINLRKLDDGQFLRITDTEVQPKDRHYAVDHAIALDQLERYLVIADYGDRDEASYLFTFNAQNLQEKLVEKILVSHVPVAILDLDEGRELQWTLTVSVE